MAETKRQHEALRVPQGWEGQAKALIMQLERILTQLYQITEKTEGDLKGTNEDIITVTDDLSALSSSFTSFKTSETLTLTRTENSYFNATSFARNAACKKSGYYFVRLNLSSATVTTATTEFIQIGTISNYSALYDGFANVMPQDGSNKVACFQITTDGKIKFFAPNGTGGAFYRAVLTIPAYAT